jgi:hypothetical protein
MDSLENSVIQITTYRVFVSNIGISSITLKV